MCHYCARYDSVRKRNEINRFIQQYLLHGFIFNEILIPYTYLFVNISALKMFLHSQAMK